MREREAPTPRLRQLEFVSVRVTGAGLLLDRPSVRQCRACRGSERVSEGETGPHTTAAAAGGTSQGQHVTAQRGTGTARDSTARHSRAVVPVNAAQLPEARSLERNVTRRRLGSRAAGLNWRGTGVASRCVCLHVLSAVAYYTIQASGTESRLMCAFGFVCKVERSFL